MGTLWTTAADRDRLAASRSAVFLVGSYDGSGNYGDVLQVATAIETAGALPDGPLPVAVVELETRAHHLRLAERYPRLLGGAAFLYYREGDLPTDGLAELGPGAAPRSAALYLYGGGYLNHRWGGRKVAHAAAAERLSRRRSLPVVASGLQVDEPAVAPGGVGHQLLSRASWIGARDRESRDYLHANLPRPAGERVELAGDDALPFLGPARGERAPVVNLHLNDGVWVSEDPEASFARVARLLVELGRAAPRPLSLRPAIAYEDPRVSERAVVEGFLTRHGAELEAAGVTPGEPLDVLDDAARNGLATFRRAELTVACSYHVTLTSLLAGLPSVLLAENEYYDQKADGLRDLFGLDRGLVGVRGDDEVAAAASTVADGAAREALGAHLGAASERLVERYERGRAAAAQALTAGLSDRGPSWIRRLAARRA